MQTKTLEDPPRFSRFSNGGLRRETPLESPPPREVSRSGQNDVRWECERNFQLLVPRSFPATFRSFRSGKNFPVRDTLPFHFSSPESSFQNVSFSVRSVGIGCYRNLIKSKKSYLRLGRGEIKFLSSDRGRQLPRSAKPGKCVIPPDLDRR